ncbi:HEAT repeat domain-containing protein [Alienimonas sp. DA493]|uniref:HEAT repeat domain-containing protein n=1 Tax=Alienimonas sp. DA493 TaxID=3373605 RepID=UPI003754D1E8
MDELGPGPLRAAALDQARPAAQRVRAIEILTEKYEGLPANVLSFFAADPAPEVRARACWSHGVREPAAPDAAALAPFLADESPRVRRAALEAFAGMTDSGKAAVATVFDALAENLGHPDRLVRSAAQRVIARLAAADLAPLARAAHGKGDAARVAFALGYLAAYPRFDDAAIRLGLNVLEGDAAPDVRRDAVRLVQIALGDYGPGYDYAQKGDGSAFEGYTAGFDLAPHERELNVVVPRLSALLARRRQGREEAAVDHELVRVAAMIAPYNPVILGELTGRLTESSDPTEDLHHLFAAARLPVERSAPQTEAIAAALVRLDAKVAERGLNTDTNWEPRLTELYDELFEKDRQLAAAVVARPDLGRPAHVALLAHVPADLVPQARARFAAAAREPGYDWSGDVVFLLGDGPDGPKRIRPLFEDRSVRGAVVMSLADRPGGPAPVDRPLFVESLDNGDLSVVAAALGALEKLPSSGALADAGRLTAAEHAAETAGLTALLRRLPDDDRGRDLKARTVALLRRNTGETTGFAAADPTSPAAAAGWTEYVAARFPDLETSGGAAESLARLATIDWESGDAARGAEVFKARGCATCHGGRGAVGPDLAGAGARYGRKDRWTAILDPSRDVPSRYRTELIVTADGRVVEGLPVYQSTDGITLRDGQGRTWRVEAGDILERRTGTNSLMPGGVMDDASDQDWADLDAYLRSL